MRQPQDGHPRAAIPNMLDAEEQPNTDPITGVRAICSLFFFLKKRNIITLLIVVSILI
jgi:hypothetical protein